MTTINCLVTLRTLRKFKEQLENLIKEAERIQDATNVSLDIAEYPETISITLDPKSYMGQCNHNVTVSVQEQT